LVVSSGTVRFFDCMAAWALAEINKGATEKPRPREDIRGSVGPSSDGTCVLSAKAAATKFQLMSDWISTRPRKT
jgi:hypothetical protein